MRVIEPASGWRFPDLRELWEHRDLIYLMARRDIAVRYKQSAVGAFWAILQPHPAGRRIQRLSRRSGDVQSARGIPYPVFAFTGMVIWLFLSRTRSRRRRQHLRARTLISKVYFPRLIIPLAAVIPPLVDFASLRRLIAGCCSGVRAERPARCSAALRCARADDRARAPALALGAHVRYRDVEQAGPVHDPVRPVHDSDRLSAQLVPHEPPEGIYALNPLVGVLEGFRWAVLRDTCPEPFLIPLSPASPGDQRRSLLRALERTFADVI